jgi:SAM-dependent methyltransferase
MTGHWGGNPYKWDWPAATNNPHIARYMLARGFIFPWETVLDAACCTGYGTKIISQVAKKVYGYEVDKGCIESAKMHQPKNVTFKVKDLDTCELPDVDVAITIETIEHLNDMHHFVDQLHKHVKRCIIVTVPLGGTSFAYVNEPPSPGTEKNDFAQSGDVQNLIAPDGSGWHLLTEFRYGYSHFGVYFKDQPEIPAEWKKKGYINE